MGEVEEAFKEGARAMQAAIAARFAGLKRVDLVVLTLEEALPQYAVPEVCTELCCEVNPIKNDSPPVALPWIFHD